MFSISFIFTWVFWEIRARQIQIGHNECIHLLSVEQLQTKLLTKMACLTLRCILALALLEVVSTKKTMKEPFDTAPWLLYAACLISVYRCRYRHRECLSWRFIRLTLLTAYADGIEIATYFSEFVSNTRRMLFRLSHLALLELGTRTSSVQTRPQFQAALRSEFHSISSGR